MTVKSKYSTTMHYTYDSGMGIISVNHGINDTVTAQYFYGEHTKPAQTYKLRTNKKGEPFFMYNSTRHYIRDFMKTDV